MKIAVVLLTYLRPAGLSASLRALSALRFSEKRAVSVRVIVVDNDAAESGRATVDSARLGFPWGLDYHVEPRRGIPQGRNLAVALALESGADAIVFLDDDEEPEAGWLECLLAVAEATAAGVVSGPVLPKYVESPPAWVVAGRFFERPRFATGTWRETAATNNVFVRAEVFHGMKPWFDERLALTGGSDTRFFRRVAATGTRIVWADNAIVWETIPKERVTPRWLIRRMYRIGNSIAATRMDQMPRARALAVSAASAFVWAARGAYHFVTFPLRREWRRHLVGGLRELGYAAGQVAALLGRPFEEYR